MIFTRPSSSRRVSRLLRWRLHPWLVRLHLWNIKKGMSEHKGTPRQTKGGGKCITDNAMQIQSRLGSLKTRIQKRERTSKHRRRTLKWPLQVSLRLTSKDIYHHGFRIVQVLEAHDALSEEGLGVPHVAVEAAHHKDA